MKKITEIKPLTSTQLRDLMNNNRSGEKKVGRIMFGNQSVGLYTGILYKSNLNQACFWEKPECFFERAIELLEKNNPKLKFYPKYSKGL